MGQDALPADLLQGKTVEQSEGKNGPLSAGN